MTEDEKYMRRAIQLARCGEAGVGTNPMVGAVIVHGGRIIGEGYHRKYGGPHAEVHAVRNAFARTGAAMPDTGEAMPAHIRQLFGGSTLYVTLEPCSHWGKTPPCCDMIVRAGIGRVVIGMTDPNSKVNGEGIRRMKAAGIEVVTGTLEAECRALNPCFTTFHTTTRPYITLKWAQLQDGTMGICSGQERSSGADAKQATGAIQEPRLQVSTPFTQMLVHRMRARCQAIMVGTNTAVQDNPSLTTRLWRGNSPLRVTIDRHGRLSETSHLLRDSSETVVYHNEILTEILYDLHKRGIQHLIVEGGSKLLQSFIDANLWDRARVEICSDARMTCMLQDDRKVVAPKLPHAASTGEYVADGNKLLILLNSKHIAAHT
ncbi:MAG: bifunctional diaminohydroxyphosphoribosylaminopyrimidine deaminase/5-amino-6-(5-phosphoribosylamino)uracil reductase RibD [Bacteroidaceae bacterium]|nr:bifunctional diaminohydroxyphosphoribosylaminopyrimidine deaminase/5-amino-6-(5-phosphoribosylamino)uracil reductase RibD [Bacteroidaceae bacterium]